MLDRRGLILLSTTILLSCRGNSLDAVTGGADSGSGSAGTSGTGGGGGTGSGGAGGTGGNAVADAGADVGSGGAAAGSGGASGSGGRVDAGANDGPAPIPLPGNSLTGMLGTLGPAKPIVAAFTIHTGPLIVLQDREARIYLSSAPLTCAQISTAGWLSSAAAGSQVTEIVVSSFEQALGAPIGAPGTGIPPNAVGEVNYAEGGKSSADEVKATSGLILTTGLADGGVHGTLDATFADGSHLTGMFNAHFCAGGQIY